MVILNLSDPKTVNSCPPTLSRLLLAACLLASGTARADIVGDWNAQALQTMQTSTASPMMARDLAILHVAMFNASESLQNNYTPQSFNGYSAPGSMSGPSGADYQAAMITAAKTVMQSLYAGSANTFELLANSQLSNITNSQAKNDGIAWGQQVAQSILTWRQADNSSIAGSTSYSPVGAVGYWSQTSASPAQLAGWGNVTPFAISSAAAYQTTLSSGSLASYIATPNGRYEADYFEVMDKGQSTSGSRTADEFTQAFFWSSPNGSVKVPGLWNQVTDQLSSTLSETERVRLFAAVNVAMADASIAAYATAYDQQFWRPETAIANGDFDGNANTIGPAPGDVWAPLIGSPDMPEFVSVTGALSGAAALVLMSKLDNTQAFSLTAQYDNGSGLSNITDSFTSISDAATQAALSGIFAGTQFRTSAEEGLLMGYEIGIQTNTGFQPVPEPSGALLLMSGFVWLGSTRRRKTQA